MCTHVMWCGFRNVDSMLETAPPPEREREREREGEERETERDRERERERESGRNKLEVCPHKHTHGTHIPTANITI